MKTKRYKRCILCEGANLAESVKIFNEEMKKHANQNPTYERYDNCFLIYITVREQEPESIAEEMELKGCEHRCIECSHCERSVNKNGEYDGRKKKAMCNKKGRKVFIDSMVCDTFYKENQDNRPFEQNLKIINNNVFTEVKRRGA